MTFTISEFHPDTQIIAHTWSGQTYDLTGDLYDWSRTKNMTLGAFSIDLVPRHNWKSLLPPQTYIEIRASKNGVRSRGELPIIMRGFVDAPAKNTQMPAYGGPSEPRITISGTDYTKILNNWQILYLFTQNIFKQPEKLLGIIAEQAGFGMFANFRIPLFSKSINDFAHAIMQRIVDPVVRSLQAHNYVSLPPLDAEFTFPDFPMNGLTIASYTGSFYNLLEYVASPPFGELFIREGVDSPVLIGRMAPYKTITGEIPRPGVGIGNDGFIEAVQSIDTQQTDVDLMTYYLTWAADAQIFNMTMPTFLPGLSNGVLLDKSRLYGVRPLQIDTPWLSLVSDNGKSGVSNVLRQAAELNAWLIATMGDNEQFDSGTIVCHGDENLQIGTYRTVASTNQEFYISSITDHYQYSVGNRWDATLQVVRGRTLQ